MTASHCLRCGASLATVHDGERPRATCGQCGWIFYDNPAPVVGAIVEHEGEIILVRQAGWPEKFYGLVTGFLERDETPEEGIVREIAEELSLAGEVVSLVGVYDFQKRNELIVAYHVRATGEIALSEELEAFKRVPIDKLRPWPVATGLAVRDWLASRAAT